MLIACILQESYKVQLVSWFELVEQAEMRPQIRDVFMTQAACCPCSATPRLGCGPRRGPELPRPVGLGGVL